MLPYGVSRRPVPEALRALAALDWITLETGKGARVARLKDEQNLDSIAVSSVLFGLSCRLAYSRLSEAQLERLTHIIRDLAKVADDSDTRRFLAYSREAWFLIVDAIPSPVISEFFDRSVRGAMVSRALETFEKPEARKGLAALWKELTVALRLRDQERAEELGRKIPMYSLEELLIRELSA